jgi:hypothetical protein
MLRLPAEFSTDVTLVDLYMQVGGSFGRSVKLLLVLTSTVILGFSYHRDLCFEVSLSTRRGVGLFV